MLVCNIYQGQTNTKTCVALDICNICNACDQLVAAKNRSYFSATKFENSIYKNENFFSFIYQKTVVLTNMLNTEKRLKFYTTMIVKGSLAVMRLCFEHNKAADAAKGFFLKIEFSKLAKNRCYLILLF